MIKFLLYLIVTISIFPFTGHLAILVLLSTLLITAFSYKVLQGTLTLNQKDYTKNRYFFWFMLGLLVYSIISVFWVVDFRGWMNYNVYLFIGSVSLIACNYVLKNSDDFYDLFYLISIYSMIHNIIGWINVLTGKYILSNSPLIPDFQEKGNPLSLFNNTNDLATFLVFSIFLCIAMSFYTKKLSHKVVLFINTLSSLILLYLTMSRANYLALILGFMTFCFFICKKKSLVYIFSIIFAVLGISIYSVPIVFGAINSFLTETLFNSGDLIRINLIKNGFVFLKDSFGFGVGAGNIPYYLENYSRFEIGTIFSLHNWWLDILITYGVGLFILYLVYYGKLVVILYKMKNTSNDFVRYTSISFISILSSYLIGSTSSSSNFPIMWIWVFFAIMISFLNIETKEEKLQKILNSYSFNELF